jgi:hypothetical protein
MTNFLKQYFYPKIFFLLLIIFLFNLYLRKWAVETNAYAVLLNYNQLYYDRDKIHIESFAIRGDSVEINLDGGSMNQIKNEFSVLSGGRLINQQISSEKNLKVFPDSLNKGEFNILINGGKDSLQVSVEFLSDRIALANRGPINNPYVISTQTLIGSQDLYHASDWTIRNWGEHDSDPDIAAETKRILDDSAQIRQNDPGSSKVLKIARFILQRTAGHEGEPAEGLSNFHPLMQLRVVQSGQSRIWCGNFSSIFSYFATKAGLPVRWVSCGKTEGRYSSGTHVFCEVFLKEQQSWVYVDLTSRNILVRYGKNWLNAIDIQRLLRYPIEDSSWVALHYEKDSLYETPFRNVSALVSYYFHPNNTFVFYFGDYLKIMTPKNIFSRAIKFFYGRPYYAIYSDNYRVSNARFYLRILTNYLLGLGILFYLFQAAQYLFKSRDLRKSK